MIELDLYSSETIPAIMSHYLTPLEHTVRAGHTPSGKASLHFHWGKDEVQFPLSS